MNTMRLGCSTYSFWHFKGPKKPLLKYLEDIYGIGFAGVEILEEHFEETGVEYLAKVKKRAFELGLDIYCIAIHNDFVNPSKEAREAEVRKVKKWIRVAARLGAKALRINSGRWRTIESFDELMARRGEEPPLEGYNEEDGFSWVVECLEKLVPIAEEYGVVLALENHWGLTRDSRGVLRIVSEVGSEWLRVLLDTGNFIEDTYSEIEKVAPYAVMVHAKTYFGGGEWYTLDLDYGKIFSILRNTGFKGWISLEYEGRERPKEGVRKSFDLLKKYVVPIG